MAASTTPRTIEQAEARIRELEAAAAESAKRDPIVAALAAAGVTTPEGVVALAQRPDLGAYATLQASVTALGGELSVKTAEIQALATRLNAADEANRKAEAERIVDGYVGQGKITVAERADFVTLALSNRPLFDSLAAKLVVKVNMHERGTGGDASDQPETLHALAVKREQDSKATGSPMNYAQAIDLVIAERPDLLDAWRQSTPARNGAR